MQEQAYTTAANGQEVGTNAALALTSLDTIGTSVERTNGRARLAGLQAAAVADFSQAVAETGNFEAAQTLAHTWAKERQLEAQELEREARAARTWAKAARQRQKEARAKTGRKRQLKAEARKARVQELEEEHRKAWRPGPPLGEQKTSELREKADDTRRKLKARAWKELEPYNAKAARRMSACERTGRKYTCTACGSQGVVPIGCDVRGCPLCDAHKADADAQAYAPMFEKKFARFMTLTVRNVKLEGPPPGASEDDTARAVAADAKIIRTELQRLTRAFRQLRQAKAFAAALDGGLWKREITLKCRAGRVEVHPHLHVMFWGRFIPQADLSRAWEARTGACIVDIRKAPGIREAVKYSCKAFNYAQDKGEDAARAGQSFQTISEKTGGRFSVGYLMAVWIRATRNLHLVRCFGDGFKWLPPEAAAICPDCGGCHWLIETTKIAYMPQGPPTDRIWRGSDLYPRPTHETAKAQAAQGEP
jgi:hypothetical protein